jgi:hypothetical protein
MISAPPWQRLGYLLAFVPVQISQVIYPIKAKERKLKTGIIFAWSILGMILIQR